MRSPSPRQLVICLPLLMFLSGLSALIYEIIWSKRLALLFGTDIRAVSISAAIFMAGLAAGSYFFGRLSDRSRNLLRLYALLELGIGAGALAFTTALTLLTPIYYAVLSYFPPSPLWQAVPQLALATLLLFPATFCMGGTLPVVCRFFAHEGLSRWLARLYGWNTAGAALGALSSAFFILPRLGLVRGEHLAIAANLLIAVAAFIMSRGAPLPQREAPSRTTPNRSRTLLLFVALIGGTSMALEILWSRLFVLYFGTTIYSFALTLGGFLIALAIGSALYSRYLHKSVPTRPLFIGLLTLMGGSTLITAPFYDKLPELILSIHKLSDSNWWLLSSLSFGIVLITIGVPVICSGALLPTAAALISSDTETAGTGIGRLVLFNTLGSMLGSLSCALLLIPTLGLLTSFKALACVLILASATYAYVHRAEMHRRTLSAIFTSAFVLVASLSLVPKWDPKIMNSGVYIYAPRILASGGLKPFLGQTRLLYSQEGPETNVAVTRSRDNDRTLYINGKADANSASDMPTQTLLGQLPMLLHPDPQEVLVIGLGSGVSAGAAASHPLARLTVSELSPAVVEASTYFASENRNILTDQRTRLVVGDGRSLLATQTERFDVIISEPSNPWQSGNANLFTREFYRLAAKRLNPGGIFCQWLPSYDLGFDNLRSAIATFLASFENVRAFYVSGDLILLGSCAELPIENLHGTSSLSLQASNSLATIGIQQPAELISLYHLGDHDRLKTLAADAPLNTDIHPRLEFAARDLNYLSNRAQVTGEAILLQLKDL